MRELRTVNSACHATLAAIYLHISHYIKQPYFVCGLERLFRLVAGAVNSVGVRYPPYY